MANSSVNNTLSNANLVKNKSIKDTTWLSKSYLQSVCIIEVTNREDSVDNCVWKTIIRYLFEAWLNALKQTQNIKEN